MISLRILPPYKGCGEGPELDAPGFPEVAKGTWVLFSPYQKLLLFQLPILGNLILQVVLDIVLLVQKIC